MYKHVRAFKGRVAQSYYCHDLVSQRFQSNGRLGHGRRAPREMQRTMQDNSDLVFPGVLVFQNCPSLDSFFVKHEAHGCHTEGMAVTFWCMVC